MTLHYEFPTIDHIWQVIQAIKGRPEFIRVDRPGDITIFNYVLVGQDTFPPVIDDDETLAILRECRGIIFDSFSGYVISRPFHKFFNVGERQDTQTLDLTRPHALLHKLDGSMVRPVPIDRGFGIRWMTKMGITDVAMQAECFVSQHPEYQWLARKCIRAGVTPIFEWCSRKQRIVIDHPEDRLVLLAIRHNVSGRYFSRAEMRAQVGDTDIPIVGTRSWFGIGWTTADLVDSVRAMEDTEGFVIRFEDGHMAKVKTDWYRALSHAKFETLRSERDVVRMILEEKTDDLLPIIDRETKERLALFTVQVNRDIQDFAHEVSTILLDEWQNRTTKARFAERCKKGVLRSACFAVWDMPDQTRVFEKAVEWAKQYVILRSASNKSFETMARQIIRTARWNAWEMQDAA
jgi:RNA ligase